MIVTGDFDGDVHKYLQIHVPSYDGSGAHGFWRLGKNPVSGTAATKKDDELLGKFKNFAQQGFVDTDGTHERSGAGSSSTTDAFKKNLGWRDHVDTNRLTTTGGDKVEVISGSYQLVVLSGETADGSPHVVVDASGGVLWTTDHQPSLVTKINRDTGDTTEELWKTGNYEGYHSGTSFIEEVSVTGIHISAIGKPAGSFADKFKTKMNLGDVADAEVREGIWATDYLDIGYSSKNIAERNIAGGTLETSMHAGTILDERLIAGTKYHSILGKPASEASFTSTPAKMTMVHERTFTEELIEHHELDEFEETVNASTEVKLNTTAGSINETVYADSYTEKVVSGDVTSRHIALWNIFDIRTSGLFTEVTLGNRATLDMNSSLDTVIGHHREVHLGGFAEVTIAVKAKKLDVVIGKEIELTTGTDIEVTGKKRELFAKVLLLG